MIDAQGKVTVDSIDDKEDMQFADEAYDILGFTKEEKYNVYKVGSLKHMDPKTEKKKEISKNPISRFPNLENLYNNEVDILEAELLLTSL